MHREERKYHKVGIGYFVTTRRDIQFNFPILEFEATYMFKTNGIPNIFAVDPEKI